MSRAALPESPVEPRPLLFTVLAIFTGLLLAASVAAVLEYFDDSLRDPEDLQEASGLPTLGSLVELSGDAKRGSDNRLITVTNPRSAAAEEYRRLRANLEIVAGDDRLRTLLLTGSEPAIGIPVVAANLAVAFAESGSRVVLVDADFRRPAIHDLLRLPNEHGLSTLLQYEKTSPERVVARTRIPRLEVVTTGSIATNPARALGPEKLKAVLARSAGTRRHRARLQPALANGQRRARPRGRSCTTRCWSSREARRAVARSRKPSTPSVSHTPGCWVPCSSLSSEARAPGDAGWPMLRRAPRRRLPPRSLSEPGRPRSGEDVPSPASRPQASTTAWRPEQMTSNAGTQSRSFDLRALAPLALAGFLIAATAAFIVSSSQPGIYEARASLSEATTERTVGPSAAEAADTARRLDFHARVAESRPILERAIERLELDLSPVALGRRLSAAVSSDGSTLEIAVEDRDASLATALANVIAEEVITASTADQTGSTSLAAAIDAELAARIDRLATLQRRVDRLSGLEDPNNRQRTRLERLSQSLQAAPGSYARLVPFSSESSVGGLAIVDPAVKPTTPVRPLPLLDAVLAGFVGILVVLPLLYVPNFLNGAVRTAHDVRDETGLPALAVVPRVRGDTLRPSRGRRAMLLAPDSSAADAYRRIVLGMRMSAPGRGRRRRPRRGSATHRCEVSGGRQRGACACAGRPSSRPR